MNRHDTFERIFALHEQARSQLRGVEVAAASTDSFDDAVARIQRATEAQRAAIDAVLTANELARALLTEETDQ
jgi:hypothetical protein